MKKLSSFMILCAAVLLSVACNAQQNEEGKVPANQLSNQPATGVRAPETKTEAAKVQTQVANPAAAEFNHGYMVLPGFTPTGNKEVDNQNYAQAKKEFVAKYPNDYVERMNQLTEQQRQEWEKQQQQTTQQTTQQTIQQATQQVVPVKAVEVPRSRYNGMTDEQKKRIDGNPQFKIVDDK